MLCFRIDLVLMLKPVPHIIAKIVQQSHDARFFSRAIIVRL